MSEFNSRTVSMTADTVSLTMNRFNRSEMIVRFHGAVVAAIGPDVQTEEEKRWFAYLELWIKDLHSLNDDLLRQAANQYVAKVGPAEGLTAAAKPVDRLTPGQRTEIRRRISRDLLRGNHGVSFDALTAQRNVDAIGAALHGNGMSFMESIISETAATKQLHTDILFYSTFEGEALEKKLRSLPYGKKVSGAINQILDAIKKGYKLEDLESKLSRLLSDAGKEVMRKPQLIRLYFKGLDPEIQESIQRRVRERYVHFVDRTLEQIDNYLALGNTKEQAITRALQLDGSGITWIQTIEENLVTYNSNLALEEWARQQSMDERNILGKSFKIWVTEGDLRVRDSHRSANGMRVPLEADFIVGGRSMGRPGDPRGGPGQTYRCRCRLAFSFENRKGNFDVGKRPVEDTE